MAELDDRELERTLGELGERLAYPRADLWPAVRERISRGPSRRLWAWPRLAPVAVTLVYRSRPGIPVSATVGASALVTEFLGTVDQNVMGKVVGPDTTLEQVTVDGAQGFWLAGAPHQFFYRDAYGNFIQETLRLAE